LARRHRIQKLALAHKPDTPLTDEDMFEWSHNLKRVTPDFLRILMLPHFTYFTYMSDALGGH